MTDQTSSAARFSRLRRESRRTRAEHVNGDAWARDLRSIEADQAADAVVSDAADDRRNRLLLASATASLYEPGIDGRDLRSFAASAATVARVGALPPTHPRRDEPVAIEGIYVAAQLLTEHADAGYPAGRATQDLKEMLRRVARAHCRYLTGSIDR